MYALCVCLMCMPYMYALHVCLMCMPYMYALYVCLICMPYMYALYVCQEDIFCDITGPQSARCNSTLYSSKIQYRTN